MTLLKSSRVLPAPVGAVLWWDGRGVRVRWGAASGPGARAPISLGMGFIGPRRRLVERAGAR